MSNYPPPPPPQQSNTNLATIKTYILIAWIFSILLMIVWMLGAVSSIISYLAICSFSRSPFGSWLLAGGIFIYRHYFTGFRGICISMVFLRIWKMYKAVNAGDIATLKATSNMMWAIIALIFAGVIPGIMLIISDGPIKQL